MIAHIRTKDKKQTVREHIEAVALLAAEKGKSCGLFHTMYLIGLLHDIGKQTQAFDDYIHKAFKNPKSVRRGEVNHSSAGGKYIYERYGTARGYQKLTAQLISTAILSHHGVIDCLKIDGTVKFSDRIRLSEEIHYNEAICNSEELFQQHHIDELFSKSVEEIESIFHKFNIIADEIGGDSITKKKEITFLISCLECILLSMLIDADRTDTAKYMTGVENPVLADKELIALWKKAKENLNEQLANFQSEDRISLLRKEISQECLEFSAYPEGIYCLPIPTGGGKTLCSLRYGLEHCLKTGKKKYFYIAPFLSILEQNAEIIKKIMDADDYVLEHHSNIIHEEESMEDECEVSHYQLMTESWESPVIMTTMVQFLNTLFSSQTQCVRRMHQLKDSVIIFDEIQSLPVRCVSMFNMMMNFLSRCCHVTVILCSATQPLLGRVKRKILYSNPVNMIKDMNQLSNDFKRVEVIDATVSGGYDSEKLAEFVLKKMQKNILIILNTKSAVKKLYQALKRRELSDTILMQLTTYMCAAHRGDIIAKLKEQLITEQKVICISTQLIEAGVDISFQAVVRSLTGLDSIAQAAGRCNRNGEAEIGYVYLVNSNDENLSSLHDIKTAKESMERILNDFEEFQDSLGSDLLMPQVMECYYQLYFYNRRGEMDNSIKEYNTSLYDLLSSNPQGVNAFKEKYGHRKEITIPMRQAFKHAGDLFEVIEKQTIDLIVPYKEAGEMIERLKNSYDPGEIKGLLKRLQRYTVNLFKEDSMLKSLLGRGAIDNSILDSSIYSLNSDFYNKNEGLSEQLQMKMF